MALAAGDRLDLRAAGAGSGARPGPDPLLYLGPGPVAYRGYKKEIETYVNPWATDDPGQPQVTSRIGDGFNLDGKIKADDFVSPDGEKGIDNNLYRAWGCDAPWRGNGNATLDLRANDKMQEGLYTMVIRVSGNQDPMNDSDATVEIGYSPDKIVKDARGGIVGGLFLPHPAVGPVHQAESHHQERRGGERAGRTSAHARASPGSMTRPATPTSPRARSG